MARSARGRGFKPTKKPHKTPPQTPIEMDIERLSDEGRGIGRLNGKLVFVKGALAGEKVSARLLKQQKRFDEAEMLDCMEASAERVEPFCKLYEQCGGCQLQHLSINKQRQHKRRRLQQLLSALPSHSSVELDDIPLLSGDDRGYRHRARLSYRRGQLGFKAEGSHDIIAFDHCPILAEPLNHALETHRASLLAYLDTAGPSELELALGDNDHIGIKILQRNRPSDKLLSGLVAALAEGITVYEASNADHRWLNPTAQPLTYSLPQSQQLQFLPGDFTQVNQTINWQILETITGWLSPQSGERIADYFCGLGNFSKLLAASGATVIGFDAGAAMIERARQQADAAGLTIDFRKVDLFDGEQLILPQGVNKLVLDPPRAGAKLLCEYLATKKSLKMIAYVSCDPGSLKRDLHALCDGGFKVEAAVVADMFPHSQHMESLVLLSR
jgi:23S rRNA (uracil1939-C5)-methyltransferase